MVKGSHARGRKEIITNPANIIIQKAEGGE